MCTFANTVLNQVHKVPSALTTSDKSPSTSFRGEKDESDTLSIATAQVLFPQLRNVVREMLMNVLLELCIQLVHL